MQIPSGLKPQVSSLKPPTLHALLILLATLVCGLPSLALPLGRDHGVILYISDLMLRGGAPYKDAWEIRPPGLFYVFASAVFLFGKTALALRWLDLLWQAGAALALAGIGRRLYNGRVGLWAGLLYPVVYFLGNDFWTIGNGDAFISLPAALAFLALLPRRKGPRVLWDLAAGLALGLVFLIRFTQGLLVIPAMILILMPEDGSRPGDFLTWLRRSATLGVGFAAAAGLCGLHLWLAGAWKDFIDILFVFAPKYIAVTHSGNFGGLAMLFLRVHFFFILKFSLVAVPALLAVFWTLGRDRGPRGGFAMAWFACVLVGIGLMAKFYGYHWLPLLQPLCLLGAVFFRRVHEAFGRKNAPAAVGGLVIILAAAAVFLAGPGALWMKTVRQTWNYLSGRTARTEYLRGFDTIDKGGDSSVAANYLAADYIKSRTAPGEGIFIWGFESLIYYLSDRDPPTRFCSNFPLIASFSPPEWTAELIGKLRANPPKYILLVFRDAKPWITGVGLDSLDTLRARMPDLRAFIEENYILEKTIGNIHLCRRKTE